MAQRHIYVRRYNVCKNISSITYHEYKTEHPKILWNLLCILANTRQPQLKWRTVL